MGPSVRPERPASPIGRAPRPRVLRRAAGSRVRRTTGLRLKTGPFRLWRAFCVVAFVISLFAARLVQLQGIDENDYAAIAAAKGAKTITLEAPRAPIYDRNGEALAQHRRRVQAGRRPDRRAPGRDQDRSDPAQPARVDYIDAVTKLRKTSTRYVELARHVKPELAASVVREIQHRGYPACTPPRTSALHERAEAFVMPNPWDVGSARILRPRWVPWIGTSKIPSGS